MIPRFWLLAVAVVGWGNLHADEISLVRVGDPWRYRYGVTEASSPETAWRETGFDDSAWLEGRSGFSLAGDEATPLVQPPVYRSVYFRKQFEVDDPATIRWLLLRFEYSGGFVAYLNGQEIVRAGLAGDPVPHDAYAEAHPRGFAVDFDVSGAAGRLVAGENLLAIQLHASASTPSSLGAVPELLANFQRGPFVQNASPDSIQVIWRTPVPAETALRYGTDQLLARSVSDPSPDTNHVVRLSDLEPDTQYYYQAQSRSGEVAVSSPVFSFRTLKRAGAVSFAVLGDSGGGQLPQLQLAQVLAQTGVDLVLHAGDILYPSFYFGHEDTRCLSVYGEQMRSTPFYFTFGNHDLYGGTDAYYLETFHLPTNSASGTEHYYSFDHGDVHFVCLFVPTLTPFPSAATHGLWVGSTQYNWLTNDLAGTAKPWKLLWFHSPLETSSAHRYDDYNFNGRLDRLELQEILLPVIRQYGVQAIFSGHDHNYERFQPIDGAHLLVSGGGGHLLYSMTEPAPASQQFWARFHCLRVEVEGDTLKLEALDNLGQAFDRVTIQRVVPPRQLWSASWHTPLFPAGPADDGDGNVTGQTFDLAGTPIPCLSGDVSNLGEALVNNDADQLYVGLRHVMVGSDQNVFLFIETPSLAGVTSLAGLGNGQVDPEGEGVDGLDFLENLVFTNFAPAVACLLGDELADGSFRSFGRPALDVNIGQGVFYLDEVFREVPGARVQQFNLSPQFSYPGTHQGAYAERNADFQVVAIPYAALGALQPGQTVRIAALVGLSGLDPTPAAQSRELDRGFLGASLSVSEGGAAILEGLEVRLAERPASEWRLRLALTGPRQLRFSWPAVVGARYHLDYTEALDEPFQPLAVPDLPRTAASVDESYDLDLSQFGRPARTLFFRLRRLP